MPLKRSNSLRATIWAFQKREKVPSYHELVNNWFVPENAVNALRLGVPAHERLLEKRSVSQRVIDLDSLLAMHLKNLAVWRRKEILDNKKYEEQVTQVWKTFQVAHKTILDPIDIRSASGLELMRKLILKQGEGYYQSLTKQK